MKRLLTLLLAIIGLANVYATGFPKVSTDKHEVWYLIQFANGGNVFSAKTNNAEISTAKAAASNEQLWKITGNEQSGFQLTNKKGYTLYSDNAAKNDKIRVSNKANRNHLFNIIPTTNPEYSGTYEIQPKSNDKVSLDLWGGPTANRGIGLWDKGDANNCVTFISLEEYHSLGKLSIIPYPSQLEFIQKGAFKLSNLKRINCADQAMTEHLKDFASQLKKASGISLDVTNKEKASSKSINMIANTDVPKEGYTLKVNKNSIDIQAAGTAGYFYALQTLKQMLPIAFFEGNNDKESEWSIPYVNIVDQPQLGHRGFMLDVARHFFDKKEIMRILDFMALYKMNLFHWHLTDDQGWRIEIPEYPKLTDVGSIRKGSFCNPGEGQKFFDDTEYGHGMWYTQEDLKEIVAYAKARNIDILPEVDFPGHMVAAITAYPELSCNPSKKYEVRLDAGISKDVLNVGNDKVIEFLKCIMDNLAEIFPYPYVHFGGDECPTDQWKDNEDCKRRVEENNLKGVHELQSWLVEELGTYIKNKYNKDIMVWDELLEHWNTNNQIKPVVMAWRNINKSKEAASKGLKSIVCPHQYLYLDMMQVTKDKALIDEVYYGGWNDDKVNSVQTIYGFNPTSALADKKDFCLGIQANMWTETTNNKEELEYQLFPRLIATAETGWLPIDKKNWTSFYKRLQNHDEIMDAMGYTYARHFIEADEKSENEILKETTEKILSESVRGGVGYPDAKIYDALTKAFLKAKDGDKKSNLKILKENLMTFQKAPIVQPQAGKIYQIISASTYYKKQFEGATLYEGDKGLRIHYTPQDEPEELWQFVATDNGYYLQNVASDKQVQLSDMKKIATSSAAKGTAIRIDKATIATRDITYIPGVVTLSAVEGYDELETQSVKRLVAQLSGDVHTDDVPALCYPGTWKIVEVTDFDAQLQGLCDKCNRIIRDAQHEETNQPSAEAIHFLLNKVLAPAKEAFLTPITATVYKKFATLYHQFLSMPVNE